MPGPKDKQNSGSDHAQPPDGKSSSVSSSHQSDKIREHHFLTGQLPGRPMTSTISSSSSATSLPGQGKPSMGEGVVNKHLKQQHFQVMPGFKGAREYAESMRESDEAYRRTHAQHPQESLQSVNRRVSNGKRERDDTGDYFPRRPFATTVTADVKFRQTEIEGCGNGICFAISLSFLLYRRLGYDPKKIFELFRKNGKAFINLQAQYTAIHVGNLGTSRIFKILQSAEESLLNGDLPGISSSAPTRQFSRGLNSAYSGSFSSTSVPPDKKNVNLPMPKKYAAPEHAIVLKKSLSYFAIAGHFEMDRDRPWTQMKRNWVNIPSRFYFFGKSEKRATLVSQETARGVTATWAMPRMDDATQEARIDARIKSDPTEEDIWNPHIATHLFAAMTRKRRQTMWSGEVVESLPYFLITVGNSKAAHAIVVEFNTDARDENITTPRGVFDPNYGWATLEQGYCSLDLDSLLHSYYFHILQRDVDEYDLTMDPSGCLIAHQLQMTTNGTTSDPAYIAQWGGLPWMQTDSK